MNKQWLAILLALSFVRVTFAQATKPASHPVKLRIALVGDSTVTDKQGWGPGFKALLNDDVECINLALGGRSSKSYRNEGHWDKFLKLDPKPDYVLIQFGHNDTKGMRKGSDRETDPDTEFRANMKRYVDEARAAGIKPILVTSLVRREFKDDGKIHSSLVPYVEVTKQVAAEMKVPLVDLHARSLALCESMGADACHEQIAPKKENGDWDNTHLNAKGAAMMGALVVDELKKAVPELDGCFKAAAATQPAKQ
jgi:pectinesterase